PALNPSDVHQTLEQGTFSYSPNILIDHDHLLSLWLADAIDRKTVELISQGQSLLTASIFSLRELEPDLYEVKLNFWSQPVDDPAGPSASNDTFGSDDTYRVRCQPSSPASCYTINHTHQTTAIAQPED
ncbi:hypothetical protein FWH30_02580, partial [Microgenomates group bacterium]|nr:hypothetical protein [Microgenomates group bacterium]